MVKRALIVIAGVLVSGCQPAFTTTAELEAEIASLRDELDSLKRSHEITDRMTMAVTDRVEEVATDDAKNHAEAMSEISALSQDVQGIESRVGY
ncbi:hypothetical protein V8J38_11120 [Brevundimonas olei]|uniref:Uncharacterized protein n=1 Tax=Brevundimonas olei TaxID=657642 RepID=A0ABZ2I845_9CAUL